MCNRDVGVAVQADGEFSGGKGVAGIERVANGSNSVNRCPNFEGRSGLSVGLQVQVLVWE
jgi:hypothetical protein